MADVEITLDDHRELDLYCASCGYNLRGLDGDPKRCPECNHVNPLKLLLWPAERIAHQLCQLESAPTLAFAGVIVIGFGGLLMNVVTSSRSRDATMPVIMCSVIMLGGIAMWARGASQFAASCMHRSGWRVTLLRFHLYAVVIFIIGHGALLATFMIPALSIFGSVFRAAGALVSFLMIAAMWFLAVLVIRKLYCRTRRELLLLQREVAVAMYLRESDRLS